MNHKFVIYLAILLSLPPHKPPPKPKPQGPLTAEHVHHMLSQEDLAHEFPLLETICEISAGQIEPAALVRRADTYY